ncbi:hypothetical protein E2C01_033839 [Portunus trituberculatus]|uniref:Uncharacterized protein n=1 Tax=Portunus trituberculatus TaxID=210409 RepID=A0A5B7F599_PORTR|nr:hypothetical protein [Portunus trituberculatus]
MGNRGEWYGAIIAPSPPCGLRRASGAAEIVMMYVEDSTGAPTNCHRRRAARSARQRRHDHASRLSHLGLQPRRCCQGAPCLSWCNSYTGLGSPFTIRP